MNKLLLSILCIITGILLIKTSIERRPRKYITLSGYANGRTWARKIPA